MIMMDACIEIKIETLLLAADEHSSGFLDEVNPDLLSEIKETFSG